jgi:hypothetical protein
MGGQRRASARPGGLAAAGLMLAVALGGCGKSAEPPPQVEVKGKVLKKASKQPVAWVAVVFHPHDALGSASYQGGTAKDGSFSLRCPAGKYRVTISPLPLQGHASGPAEVAAPGKSGDPFDRYRNPEMTPLKVEIPTGGTSDLVIPLP